MKEERKRERKGNKHDSIHVILGIIVSTSNIGKFPKLKSYNYWIIKSLFYFINFTYFIFSYNSSSLFYRIFFCMDIYVIGEFPSKGD